MARRFPTPLFGVPSSEERFHDVIAIARRPDSTMTWDEYRERCRATFTKPDSDERYSQSYVNRISSTFVQLGLVDRDDDVVEPSPPGEAWLDGEVPFEEFLWRAIKRRWVLVGAFPEGMEALDRVHAVVSDADRTSLTRGAIVDRLAEEDNYEFNDEGIRGYPDLLVLLGAFEETDDGYQVTDAEETFKRRFRESNVFKRLERRLNREGANAVPPDDRVKRDLAKYYMYRESGGWTKRRTWYETFWEDYLTPKARAGETTAANFDVEQKYLDARSQRDELKDEICTAFQTFDRSSLDGLSADVLRRMANVETVEEARRILVSSGSGISRADLTLLGGEREPYTFPGEFSLYDWQAEAADGWFDQREGGERPKKSESGIAKVVTGAGKTVMALEVLRRWLEENPDGVVTVVVPTRVLMRQWLTELRTKLQVPTDELGWAGGGHKDTFDGDCRILVTIVNSAVQNDHLGDAIADAGEPPHLLVADECHRYTGKTFSEIFSYPRSASLGLSATPLSGNNEERSEDDEVLLDELGPIYYELSYAEGLERGLIPRFTVKYIGFDLTDSERQTYDRFSRKVSNSVSDIEARYGDRLYGLDGNYAHKLQVLMNESDGPTPAIGDYFEYTQERRDLIANAVQRQAITHDLLDETIDEGKQAIIFQERIEQLEQMIAPYESRGINARTGEVTEDDDYRSELYQRDETVKQYDQKLEELFQRATYKPVMYHSGHSRDVWNDFAMEWFRDGFANVMLSVKALVEGVDVPSADVGIVRVSNSSVRQRIQTLGRVLRTGTDETRRSELYVLYARDTVDEQIFAEYDWDKQFENADVEHYIWEANSLSADSFGSLREAREDELPEPGFGEPSVPDPDELSLGDPYPGPRDGYRISVDSDGDPFEKTEDGRQPIVTPAIVDVAEFVHQQKGGGTIIINEADHMLTILEDGPVFLGTIEGVDEIEYGETGGGLLDDPPSLDEI